MTNPPIYAYLTHTHIVDYGIRYGRKRPHLWLPGKTLCGGRYNEADLVAPMKGPLCKTCEKIWNDKSNPM